MLRAVRVFARQQMPNYRKPASFLIKESYPLPPYSSVIGLVHNMCGWSEYHPMRVSIQGCSASTVNDYATNYAFGSIPLDRAQLTVECGGGKQAGVARMPRSYELLTDVELLLHIIPDDETLVSEICHALSYPPVFPSLGRFEDLLQIEDVAEVDLGTGPESFTAKHDAYVPLSSIDSFFSRNITGTIYRLGKVFEYDNGKNRLPAPGKKCIRVWKEIITAKHICAGAELIGGEDILYDNNKEEAVYPA